MIQVVDLVKTFGNFTAVDHVSFEVGRGEIFAFLGPNGAGKTTTIKMLTTLLRPSGGAVKIDGLDPTEHPHDVRKRFGIVFQDPSLDGDMTAHENMELHGVFYHVPRKIRAERIERLLRLFELWDRRNEQVKRFSGGMKRRLEIARGPAAHSQDPVPGRADPGPRSADPESTVDARQALEPVRRRHRVSDHALHGRGRARGAADRRYRPREDRGARHAAGVEAKTGTESLEEAFLALTGSTIRDESANSADQMRQMAKLWGNRR